MTSAATPQERARWRADAQAIVDGPLEIETLFAQEQSRRVIALLDMVDSALDAAAESIERELICCDVFERLSGKRPRDLTPEERAEIRSHAICYWSEASRRLVLEQRGDALVEEATADHADDLYVCPTTGETESLSMGGFAVCCDHPECPGNPARMQSGRPRRRRRRRNTKETNGA